MRIRRGTIRHTWGKVLACALLLATGATARGQTPATTDSPAADAPTEAELVERQSLVRDRVQRLESRMLKLSRLLEESEPEKAERLRDALKFAGSRRVKARVEKLTELLRSQRLSDADREQELLLSEFDALLTLLTSSLNEVERRRAERQRLEQLKRAIRTLIDEQTEILYRTRQAAEEFDESNEQAPAEDVEDALRRLERLQRGAHRKGVDLERDMGKSKEQQQSTPGAPHVERAVENMKQAADRLGDRAPSDAAKNQQAALDRLRQALDELDDALRQVRREESEETLAALEVRFRSMLEREQAVLETAAGLHKKGVEQWTRVDQLQLAEAAETQRSVHEDCTATRRILIDEGTTVIVPELVGQMAGDMEDLVGWLKSSDVGPETQRILADVIDLLEEVLAAIEAKREQDASQSDGDGQSGGGQSQGLLPGSAELKMLRSSQLRLNARTRQLGGAAETPTADQSGSFERLSDRQRRLADLARRMNERK